jgi:hypothetical protein
MKGCLFLLAALALCGTAQARTFAAPEAPAVAIEIAAVTPLELDLAAPPIFDVAIAPPQVMRGMSLQCAVYARLRSGLNLRGLARSWWGQAQGRYARASAPAVGAVLVLGGTSKGHVAVVAKLISPTQILVDHANWMNRGEVQLGALMEDVSAHGDWSAVRVWYPPIAGLGAKAYPVMGFILPGAAA